jgi:hypothetical protein
MWHSATHATPLPTPLHQTQHMQAPTCLLRHLIWLAGSTDSLRQRIAAHRRRKPSSSSRVGGGPGIEVAYVALAGDRGGASMARLAEAAVIQALQRAAFPLLSATDARRRHAPKFT